MSETFNNIGKRIVETTGNNTGTMFMFVFVFVISIYVAYQLYNIVVKTDLQTKVLSKDVLNIGDSTRTGIFQLNLTSDDEIVALPTLNNGNEYSFSYWLFVDEFKASASPKLVLTAGEGATIESANIIMYLDPEYTKMNFLMKTTTSTPTTDLAEIHNNFDTGYNCNFFKMEVPYVPISRWINITVVVDDNYIQLFMDGELRQVIDTSEATTCSSNAQMIMQTLSGSTNFYAGKPPNCERMDGFISKLKFFNYALTIDHAKMVYKTGPVHQSILSKLGLPLYGVRNPFYRVDDNVENDSE